MSLSPGLEKLRNACIAQSEFDVTDGWLRRQWDGVLEVGPYRPYAHKTKARDWAVVPYLAALILVRDRVHIQRLDHTPWSPRADRLCRWLCGRGHKWDNKTWLRVTL